MSDDKMMISFWLSGCRSADLLIIWHNHKSRGRYMTTCRANSISNGSNREPLSCSLGEAVDADVARSIT